MLLLLIGLFAGLLFLIVVFFRKYVRFVRKELDKEELSRQVDRLNYELFQAIQERDKILHDLFLWKEGELNSSFLYKWKWAELYEEISKDKGYPFIDIENEALENFRYNNKFLKILNNTKYITDVWSGDGQKIVSLLWRGGPYKDRSPVAWKGTYIPEDYSRQMLNIAEMNIKAKAPHINLWSSQKLNGQCNLSKQCRNNMYLFLWGTICNMTDEEIITELPEWNIEPPVEINRGQNEIRWVVSIIKKTRKNI